jgi:putative SOS response-associated peptidase YedK
VPLAFAGLWEGWKDPVDGETILSATIIVGVANPWMSRFHDRMPVLLDPQYFDEWLCGERATELLRPALEDAPQEWTVSPRVNRSGVGDDDPTLTRPSEAARGGVRLLRHG